MILKMLDETFEDDGWIELYTCSCLEGTSCDMPFQLVERRETTLSLASRWEAGTGLQEVTLSAILLYFSGGGGGGRAGGRGGGGPAGVEGPGRVGRVLGFRVLW
jgi:hypothetical protein